MIRMRVSDKSVSDLNLVLCCDAKDLVDAPRAVHHRNFACLCRADEIDKILHRTHFDLFEVEPAVHFADGLQNENCKVQKVKISESDLKILHFKICNLQFAIRFQRIFAESD